MQRVHVAQGIAYHALLGLHGTQHARVVRLAPLLAQADAVGRHRLGQGAVLVVGVQALELADVVALGLQLLARERHQLVAQVEVVRLVAVHHVGESSRHRLIHQGLRTGTHAGHPERVAQAAGVGHQPMEHRTQVALADRLHVGHVPTLHEAQHEEAVHHGPLRVVEELPTTDVGHVQVAVHALALHRKGAQEVGISRRHRAKGYIHCQLFSSSFLLWAVSSTSKGTISPRIIPTINRKSRPLIFPKVSVVC